MNSSCNFFHADRFYLHTTSIIMPDFLLRQNYTNIFEIPKFEKITVHTTSNFYALERKNLLAVLVAFELLTGQKAKFTVAKKSHAPFKIREKQILGCIVTLRKKKLYNFLNLLSSVIFPKLRDFRGISHPNSGEGCFGFSSLLVFPQLENHFDIFQNFHGIDLNFTSKKSLKTKTLSKSLFHAYQIPSKKEIQ